MKEFRELDSHVYIESGVFNKLATYVNNLNCNKGIFIVSDENVLGLYEKKLRSILVNDDLHLYSTIPGESSKSIDVYNNLIKQMLEDGIKRSSLIIGFGGGVVLDLAGFVASTLFRGTELMYIPTTIIGQIDAGVGGKNGIDMFGYKNIVGNFYSPSVVLIDSEFLKTLPQKEIINGYGEIIKTALISDNTLFEKICSGIVLDDSIIADLVSFKIDIAKKDFKDFGIRRILNFGHTMGHAIEAKSSFNISHGEAVAYGMVYALKLGIKEGITKPNVLPKVLDALKQNGLYQKHIDFSGYLDYFKYDKKNTSNGLDFVFLSDIGKPLIKRIVIKWLLKRVNYKGNLRLIHPNH